MKKISKKLSLASQTVRVLSGNELEGVAGGGAQPTTTVQRHSINAAAAIRCRFTGFETALCIRPPAAG